MGVFTFKSLYINLDEKKLIVNGKEIPFRGITDFHLNLYPVGGWILEIKRNALADAFSSSNAPSDQGDALPGHQ